MSPRKYLVIAAAPAVVALLAVALLSLGPGPSDDDITSIDVGDPGEAIVRGEYLAIAGNCATCHTAPDGEFMAGGLRFETPFGAIYSTNITSDAATGIGEWSFAQFRDSMRYGLRADGEHLYPAFPYTSFTKMTDEDIGQLFEYMKSVPAVQRDATPNELSFPFNQRSLLAFWKAMFFDDSRLAADESRSNEWNRGAYLVEALTHCGACHTPRNAMGAEDADRYMAGGEYLDRVKGGAYQAWSAPDLTSNDGGLGLWPHADVADYLKTGRNSFLESFGPMNEVIMNSTRHLTEDDVGAIATYLKDIPGAEWEEAPAPDPSLMGRGRTVYNLHCGTCHLPTGLGDPEMGPRLNQGSLVVQAENPASMINAILYAPELAELPEQWRMPMEEYRYELDDEEVAAVATYIRNSWDNRAGIVTPEQVAAQR
ncbi:MAG: c-type cytochrome [Woeseiaceae bacterium]